LRERVSALETELKREREMPQCSQEPFRELADRAPFMIWSSGADALCTFVNRAWLDYRGRTFEEETGNGWTEGIHPDDRDLCLETYLKSFSARHPFRMHYRLMRASGEYAWVECLGLPSLGSSGAFHGYIGATIDIDEHKRAVFVPDEDAVRMVFALTERERQVLVMIADGRSTKEAARRLGISYKTADSHRSRVLEKLGVHETASMVRYAIRAGLVRP
jgi:PAS domain S-box-containing protein